MCPPFTLLPEVGAALAGSGVALGGQDCHPQAAGAFTGSVSAEMLKDAGCSYVIVGHSERRHGSGETDADVQAKTCAAWRAGLVAIVCVGETRAEREAGRAIEVVAAQLAGSLPDGADAARLVVAYEPVWAIGTGLTPTTGDIVAMHEAIRGRIRTLGATRILYGGSVNPKNAAEILALGGGRRRAGRRRQPQGRRLLGHRPGGAVAVSRVTVPRLLITLTETTRCSRSARISIVRVD